MEPNSFETELYKALFFIASGLISILLTVLIWSAQRLVDTVKKLGIVVQTLLTQMDERKSACTEKHQVIDTQLNAHSCKLAQNSEEIVKLKTILQ